MQQQKEKIRVYALARELKIELKDVLQYCKELGFEVKNQLSSLDPEQCDQLKLRIQRGNKAAPSAPAPVRPNAAIAAPLVEQGYVDGGKAALEFQSYVAAAPGHLKRHMLRLREEEGIAPR